MTEIGLGLYRLMTIDCRIINWHLVLPSKRLISNLTPRKTLDEILVYLNPRPAGSNTKTLLLRSL